MNLTHIDSKNNPRMVDVSAKEKTSRNALASGKITMNKEAFAAFKNNTAKKGPVAATAITAAILGAKKTSDIIPMCHNLALSKISCDISVDDATRTITFRANVACEGKTGVEMEALSAVSIGLLTIYDMLKALDKSMLITDIMLERKIGGKSGDFKRTSH